MLIVVRCRVCHHAKRSTIEHLSTVAPVADVAAKFRLSESALERHMTSHIEDAAPPTSRSPGTVPRAPAIVDPRLASRLGEAILEVLRTNPETHRRVLEAVEAA